MINYVVTISIEKYREIQKLHICEELAFNNKLEVLKCYENITSIHNTNHNINFYTKNICISNNISI